MEIWTKIEGFTRYYISSMGRIWNGERIMVQSTDKERYLLITLKNKKYKKTFRVHRLVGIYFIPNPDNKPEINHLDYNVQNNECYNIQWSTRKENMEHAAKNGLVGKHNRFGENNGRAKINLKIAEEIRQFGLKNYNRKNIASIFNVSLSTIDRILTNKTWI